MAPGAVDTPSTVTWTVVAVWESTTAAGDGDTGGAASVVGSASGWAPPPGAESKASWSTS